MHILRSVRCFRDDRASEIAEAALVLPLAFMVLLGIYWFGRAFNTYATINQAAREGARVAVAQSCGNCGNAAPSAATVAGVVSQTLQASSIDSGQVKSYKPAITACPGATSSCPTVNNVTVCTNVKLDTPPVSSGTPACGVVVSFQYPYQFWLPFTSLNNQQIILTADVQMAGEY
ncbi:MAG TPA: TadE/TadG family type IV pilus assembly protein [Terriglobales bacterium]|nr:TadE/TadG family type IV pilus assembly protein [Terriglobales bacterium]